MHKNTSTVSTMESCKGYYVYELPVRLWHWSMALSIGVLTITGYTIGTPWHSLTGDPTYLFYFGYTRMAHFIAGYVLAIGLLGRILFAFVGNTYAREVFIIPFWKKAWWQDLWQDICWYLFLLKEPVVHKGHNPLAQLGMFSFLLFLVFTCFTGLALYYEQGPVWYLQPFHVVVHMAYALGGNSIDLHSWHRLGMKLILAFVIVHVYMVIREEIMGRTTLLSTICSGYRQVREPKSSTKKR